MQVLKSGQNSGGLAEGKAYVVRTQEPAETACSKIADPQTEINRFESACKIVQHELELLATEHPVFAAHGEMIADPMLTEGVCEKILTSSCCAVRALRQTVEELCEVFMNIEDEYLRTRIDDLRDVGRRIERVLNDRTVENPFAHMPYDSVIVADELSPSDTALMDFSRLSGIITASGSSTSHVAIIARSRGVVAWIGVGSQISLIKNGDWVLLDGERDEIIVTPDESIRLTFLDRLEQQNAATHHDVRSACISAITRSGRRIDVLGNAGSIAEVHAALVAGAEGIGLFRSELLYMNTSDFPDEQAQYETYRAVAECCGDRPLTIRTLDIGGDKSLPYFTFAAEQNPFMGWRAIRISLARRDLFRTQLRALLRASASGNLRIMFPMIATCDELHEARMQLNACMQELTSEGLPYNTQIRTGVMIETPAAVIMADRLAAEADFFSIGTNDLTQYIMAADRGNARVGYLCNPMNEAVQRAIAYVIRIAHNAGIECGMCGELAADNQATSLLLEMGLTEFSVGAAAVASLKARICNSR